MLHRWASLSSAAAGVTVLVALGGLQLPAGSPAVRVVPTPATAAQTVSAIGSGFCASPGCGRVEITIDGSTVATGQVSSSGAFEVDFPAPSIPDQYTVVAEQPGSPGSRAITGLLVAASDPLQATTTTTDGGADGGGDDSTTSRETTGDSTDSTADREPGDGEAASEATDHSASSPLPWLIGAVLVTTAIVTGVALRRRRMRT